MSDLTTDAIKAKEASRLMAVLSTETKDRALADISKALLDNSDLIFKVNKEDIELAEQTGLETPLLKRLKFDETKLNDVRSGIEGLIGLPDPVGKKLLHTTLNDGLELYKVTCPIGVIGVIFESRPSA